ncbi:hypothetical protein ACF3DV_25090 [Chlorogloeopsis fritschii PCC 9212]|nr:hypothetical protein [Chlorogloeopsis fritschii]
MYTTVYIALRSLLERSPLEGLFLLQQLYLCSIKAIALLLL